MKKTSKKSDIEKGINDVSWGATNGVNATTVAGLMAIDHSLTPAESYQLSIDLKRAIMARATIARAKLRFFSRKHAEEIVTGDAVSLFKCPAPGWTTYRFLNELVSNWHLGGEYVISLLESEKVLQPQNQRAPSKLAGMYPLNPLRLHIVEPITAVDASQVIQWRYMWQNGLQTFYGPGSIVFYPNFNPLNNARGMAPVFAGVNEISANYQATRYNKQFFANNMEPSHVVILPPGITPQDKEAFIKEYFSMHSGYAGQAFKACVVEGGTGFEIKQLQQQQHTGQFLDLIKITSNQIQKLSMASLQW